MKIFSRSMKSSSDSLERSVRLTRRTATVTISAPEAAWARAISGKLRYLPVPTIKRDWKARPAITSESDMVNLSYDFRTDARFSGSAPVQQQRVSVLLSKLSEVRAIGHA